MCHSTVVFYSTLLHNASAAGPKSTRVQLQPHSSATVSWQAVPYHTGILRLPEITLIAAGGQQVEATAGCTLFAERPAEQVEGAEGAALL